MLPTITLANTNELLLSKRQPMYPWWCNNYTVSRRMIWLGWGDVNKLNWCFLKELAQTLRVRWSTEALNGRPQETMGKLGEPINLYYSGMNGLDQCVCVCVPVCACVSVSLWLCVPPPSLCVSVSVCLSVCLPVCMRADIYLCLIRLKSYRFVSLYRRTRNVHKHVCQMALISTEVRPNSV